jgi:hypothetical protein
MTDEHIFFRYHQSSDPEQIGCFMIFKRNPEAYWFDDYRELVTTSTPEAFAKYSA